MDVNCYKLLNLECQVPYHYVYQIELELNLVILGFGITRCIASGIISVIIKIGTLLVRLPYSPEGYLFGA